MRAHTTFWAAFLFNTALLGAVYLLVPELRPQLVEEDQWIENSTAALLLVACTLAALRTARATSGAAWRPMVVGALALVACLDELSFGERLFGLSMPSLGERKLDGVHDLVNVTADFLRAPSILGWVVPGGLVALVAVVLFVVAHRASWTRAEIWRRLRAIARDPSLTLLGVGIALAAGAILLDLHLVSFGGSRFFEELFEMNAALALAFAAWLSAASPREPFHPGADGPARLANS